MGTLIGLGYKARQGKNFVANYMVEHATREVGVQMSCVDGKIVCTKLPDKNIKLYAFADELKLYCAEHHDELLEQWQLINQTQRNPPWKNDPIYGCTTILQWYGTDVARKQDPDTWVKALDARLSRENPEIAIVTDVRFPNEAAYIKQNAGYLVEVRRYNTDGSQFLDKDRDPNHPSEVALDDYEGWDFIITCKDGDLKGLKSMSIGVYNLVTGNYNSYDELVDQAFDVVGIHSNALMDSILSEDSQGDGFKFTDGLRTRPHILDEE